MICAVDNRPWRFSRDDYQLFTRPKIIFFIPMDEPYPPNQINFPPVHADESGQKLLNFLHRRLNLPQSLLHRWLRTGQIRLNGSRCKPFDRIAEGDIVRLPPFALKLAGAEEPLDNPPPTSGPVPLEFLPSAHPGGEYHAINKPAGLPAHGGSGHWDSVAARLKKSFQGSPFMPVPAHRLDKDTSGVLLIATNYTALRRIQDGIRSGSLRKEYVAWIAGQWPWKQPVLLHDWLRRDGGIMRVCAADTPGAREAMCVVSPLKTEGKNSLLHILLLTGRRHQIRAQLASRGDPILGDARYGNAPKGSLLRLHSLRASLPGEFEFYCAPPWHGEFAIAGAPAPLCQEMTFEQILELPAP